MRGETVRVGTVHAYALLHPMILFRENVHKEDVIAIAARLSFQSKQPSHTKQDSW